MSTTLTLDNITIRQDTYGRYCLNDLHAAAGGEKRHQPNSFIATDQAQGMAHELVNLLLNREIDYAPLHTKAGPVAKGGGTYVVKQLVYAYAMWISPSFSLKVVDAYDRLATQGVAVHEDRAEDVLANPLEYMGGLCLT